jgi:Holliday junction resolvase-like predicted endonuclease
MTVAEDIMRLLRDNPEGLSDGIIAQRLGKIHQQIQQTCVRLAQQGGLVRDTKTSPITNRLAPASQQVPSVGAGKAAGSKTALAAGVRAEVATSPSREWFWEGNVQSAVVAHLVAAGWRIVRAADTANRERGTDIVAQRDGTTLHVEVKGWPSSSYSDPTRAGEIKRTQPTLQAGHYFAGVVLSAMQLRQRHPEDEVAVAFPDMPRYQALSDSVQDPLSVLHIGVLLVSQSGAVK